MPIRRTGTLALAGTLLAVPVAAVACPAVAAPTPPHAPSNLTVKLAKDADSGERYAAFSVSWKDTRNETGFEVYYEVTFKGERLPSYGIAKVPINSTTFDKLGATYGWLTPVTGCFKVRAVNRAGASPWTPKKCATTTPKKSKPPKKPPKPASGPPAAPTDWAIRWINQSTAQVTWKDNSNNEDGFRVLASSAAGGWKRVTEKGPNTTEYLFENLPPSPDYQDPCFLLWAYNAKGSTLATDMQYINTRTCPPRPQLSK